MSDDDDLGDLFRAMAEQTKAHRAKKLAEADLEGWTALSEYHFRRMFGTTRVDWWPSGGKAQVEGKMVYGHFKVNQLIAKLKAQTL